MLPIIQNGTLSLFGNCLNLGSTDYSTISNAGNMISKIMANTPLGSAASQSFVGAALVGLGSTLLQELVSGNTAILFNTIFILHFSEFFCSMLYVCIFLNNLNSTA